jgi:hypothetical protein
MKHGNHLQVAHYDGAYFCLSCGAEWGALPNNPPMPVNCKSAEVIGSEGRIVEVVYRYIDTLNDPVDEKEWLMALVCNLASDLNPVIDEHLKLVR